MNLGVQCSIVEAGKSMLDFLTVGICTSNEPQRVTDAVLMQQLWPQHLTFQVHVLVVNIPLLALFESYTDRPDSQWNMPLQISHLVLGFLTTSSFRLCSPLYLKTLRLVADLFLNTSVGGRSHGVTKYAQCIAHTQTLFRDQQLQLLFPEPVTTCLGALFRWDHSVPSPAVVSETLLYDIFKAFLFFSFEVINLLGLESRCLDILPLSFLYALPREAGWNNSVMGKSLCSGARLG